MSGSIRVFHVHTVTFFSSVCSLFQFYTLKPNTYIHLLPFATKHKIPKTITTLCSSKMSSRPSTLTPEANAITSPDCDGDEVNETLPPESIQQSALGQILVEACTTLASTYHDPKSLTEDQKTALVTFVQSQMSAEDNATMEKFVQSKFSERYPASLEIPQVGQSIYNALFAEGLSNNLVQENNDTGSLLTIVSGISGAGKLPLLDIPEPTSEGLGLKAVIETLLMDMDKVSSGKIGTFPEGDLLTVNALMLRVSQLINTITCGIQARNKEGVYNTAEAVGRLRELQASNSGLGAVAIKFQNGEEALTVVQAGLNDLKDKVDV